MKNPGWLNIFLFQLDWVMADARMFRADRMKIIEALERVFQYGAR